MLFQDIWRKWETARKTIYSHFQQSFDELRARVKDLGNRDHSGDWLVDREGLKPITDDIKMVESPFETLSEERYYQQSKRSQYYKDFQLVKEEIISWSITWEKNDLDCLQYTGYILNNWIGLASLWSNIHLGCQSKDSRKTVIFGMEQNIWKLWLCHNPPRTQGIIELHQKLTKHITLSTKKTKSWFSYCWLQVKEDIFSSTLSNQFVQNRKKPN